MENESRFDEAANIGGARPADGVRQQQTKAFDAGVQGADELHNPGGDPAIANGWPSTCMHLYGVGFQPYIRRRFSRE